MDEEAHKWDAHQKVCSGLLNDYNDLQDKVADLREKVSNSPWNQKAKALKYILKKETRIAYQLRLQEGRRITS